MKRRVAPYAFSVLLSMLLSLLPSAIFADLMTPFDRWEQWYWKGQPHPRPRFTSVNLPPALRAELAIFRVLARPPSWVREKITGYPTVYATQFEDRGIIYETAGVPPFAFAISHLAWALPFWFILAALIFELSRFLKSWRTKSVT